MSTVAFICTSTVCLPTLKAGLAKKGATNQTQTVGSRAIPIHKVGDNFCDTAKGTVTVAAAGTEGAINALETVEFFGSIRPCIPKGLEEGASAGGRGVLRGAQESAILGIIHRRIAPQGHNAEPRLGAPTPLTTLTAPTVRLPTPLKKRNETAWNPVMTHRLMEAAPASGLDAAKPMYHEPGCHAGL